VSLKSIELQVALPKTQEVGKIQNQFHQRAAIEQTQLIAQMRAKEIEKRKKTEKTKKSLLNEKNTTRDSKVKEPYKGKYIDIEL